MKNRHERRKAAVLGEYPKARLIFHTDPLEVSQAHIAVFMVAASYTYTTAQSLRGKVGEVSFPIHIAIEFGGKKFCGSVEPSDGSEVGEPLLRIGECN